MIFATEKKCNDSVDLLVPRFAHLLTRLKVFSDQDKVVGSFFSPIPGVRETEVQCLDIWTTLQEAKEGLRRGLFSARTLANSLTRIEAIATAYERSLTRMERDNAAGKAAANAHFGDTNA